MCPRFRGAAWLDSHATVDACSNSSGVNMPRLLWRRSQVARPRRAPDARDTPCRRCALLVVRTPLEPASHPWVLPRTAQKYGNDPGAACTSPNTDNGLTSITTSGGHLRSTWHARGRGQVRPCRARPADRSLVAEDRSAAGSAAGRDRILGPCWVRGALGPGGPRAVTNGHQRREEPQVERPPAQAARTTPTCGSDCGPEGRGSSRASQQLLRACALATRHVVVGDRPRPAPELMRPPTGPKHLRPRRPCHLPAYRTGNPGALRTTTVILTTLMSWRSGALTPTKEDAA